MKTSVANLVESLLGEVAPAYKEGDKVKYTSAALKSMGMYTDVPDYGVIVGPPKQVGSLTILPVKWQGDYETRKVNVKNIMPFGKPDYSGM